MSEIEVRLKRRRDRAIAAILAYKELEVDRYLPPEVSAKLRKVILDEVNSFHEAVVDFGTGSAVLNELFATKLDEIHEAVVVNRGS